MSTVPDMMKGIPPVRIQSRPRLRELAGNVDSISGDLERICDHLESITSSLARLVALAERVETAITSPARLLRRFM